MKEKISRRDFLNKSAVGIGLLGIDAKGTLDNSVPQETSKGIPLRKLGRTNRMVTCLGFGGGSRFTGIPYEGDAERLIDHAVQLGITYFDAARSYGGGITEKRYGRYLTPKYRNQIFLNSKTEQRTYDGVMRELDISLKTLNTDYLDLYCMHGIDNMGQVNTLLSPTGGYKAFLKIKEDKIAQNIGFSFHVWNEASQTAFKEFDIDAVLCAINASRDSGCEENLIPLAAARNVGVIAIKTTAQNALVGLGGVTGKDLVRYAISLPIAVANVGMEGLGSLESCVDIAKEPLISKQERDRIFKQLGYDPKIHKLPYFHG
jgi:predicted aldo/keto reductase-like oxidoreductase